MRMSSLTHIEKQKLERELRMSGGYVLDFSNRTFEEFFREVVGVQIYESHFDLEPIPVGLVYVYISEA